jgi:outer membrane receptor protein involved in Fe transport
MIAANGKNAGDYSSPAGIIEQSHYSDYDLLIKVSRTGDNSQFYLTFLNYWGVDIGKPGPEARLKPRWYPKERNTIFTMGYKIQNTLYLDTLNASFYFLLPMLETRKDNLRESLTVEKRSLAKIEGRNFGFKVRGGKRLGETHTLNFGFDFFGRRGVNDSNTEWIFDDFGNITEKTEETSLLDGRRNNFGLYIDDKIRISPSVTMNLGARFDYINTSNFTHSSNKISKSDQSFTAYIGSIFQVTKNFSLLANLGRSFRFPTISELFYTGLTGRGTAFGNVDLKPERSVNVDFGFRYFHEKFYASIYGFRNSVSDLIQKYSLAGEDEYYYRNLTQGHITGIEGEFYFSVIDNCELFINFHHMVGKEKNTDASLNYVPASRITFWTKFSPGKFWAEPKITFAAPKKDPGPLEIEIKGYTLLDAIFGYEFNQNLTLLAIAQNVLNKTYRLSADEKGVDAPGRGLVFKISYSF